MGAILQVLPAHDCLDDFQQFPVIIDPSGLDGSFTGYGVEHLVPDGIRGGGFAPEQVVCQLLHRLLGGIGAQIHGNLPQQQGVFSEFLQFKAQGLHHGQVCHQDGDLPGLQPKGNGRKKALAQDGLLVGLQLVKEDPLMGGVLVDEKGIVSLLYQDIGPVQLSHHAPLRRLRHGELLLLRLRNRLRRRFRRQRLGDRLGNRGRGHRDGHRRG